MGNWADSASDEARPPIHPRTVKNDAAQCATADKRHRRVVSRADIGWAEALRYMSLAEVYLILEIFQHPQIGRLPACPDGYVATI